MSECLKISLKSNTITKTEYKYFIENTFTIRLEEKQDNTGDLVIWRIPEQLRIEPRIYNIIEDISKRIEHIGYKVLYNDYGNGDICYELIIGDKNY